MPLHIGPIIFDLERTSLSPEEVDILNHPLIGGVILFTRNFESKAQITSLIKELRSKRKAPLLVSIDQEGGRVQRFRSEFTAIPPMAFIGEVYDHHPEDAERLSFLAGLIIALELREVDIDITFAPVLDLNKNLNLAIGNRAFHANPQIIITLAQQFILGMHKVGMQAVGKHFPGHGSIVPDTHHSMAVDARPLSAIIEDIKPFAALIQKNLLAGIMPAHIIFSAVDDQPVGFSSVWLKEILQKKLKFPHMIFSDDLSMKAASANLDIYDRCQIALSAGCDMLLICNDRANVVKALDTLPQKHIAIEKFLAIKPQKNTSNSQLHAVQHEFMLLQQKYYTSIST